MFKRGLQPNSSGSSVWGRRFQAKVLVTNSDFKSTTKTVFQSPKWVVIQWKNSRNFKKWIKFYISGLVHCTKCAMCAWGVALYTFRGATFTAVSLFFRCRKRKFMANVRRNNVFIFLRACLRFKILLRKQEDVDSAWTTLMWPYLFVRHCPGNAVRSRWGAASRLSSWWRRRVFGFHSSSDLSQRFLLKWLPTETGQKNGSTADWTFLNKGAVMPVQPTCRKKCYSNIKRRQRHTRFPPMCILLWDNKIPALAKNRFCCFQSKSFFIKTIKTNKREKINSRCSRIQTAVYLVCFHLPLWTMCVKYIDFWLILPHFVLFFFPLCEPTRYQEIYFYSVGASRLSVMTTRAQQCDFLLQWWLRTVIFSKIKRQKLNMSYRERNNTKRKLFTNTFFSFETAGWMFSMNRHDCFSTIFIWF